MIGNLLILFNFLWNDRQLALRLRGRRVEAWGRWRCCGGTDGWVYRWKNWFFLANSFSKVWFWGFLQTLIPLSPDKWVLREERDGHNFGEKDFQFFHPFIIDNHSVRCIQSTVFFSHNKPAPVTSQPALFFSHNKSVPATSHSTTNRVNDGRVLH
jgi:hypothetical protein